MSRTLAKVGMIAGAVALVATGVGAAAGAGLFTASTAAGAATAASISATAGSVASIASAVAIAAQVGAAVTAKPPNARGSVNGLLIGSNLPTPYVMGQTYSGGTLIHRVGYGGTVDKVDNPYRFLAIIHSLGPIAEFVSFQADFAALAFSGMAATGYYSGFLYRSFQLGACPEASALALQWPGAPGWGLDAKLSGKAAIGWGLKFDKKGKVFAAQVPQLGAVLKGVLVYDPRKDNTYPGGSGSHRIDDETTWEWSDNPGLHGLTYALGRYQNGVKVFGVDLGANGIDIDTFVAWANVCEANGWTVGGTIYEPGDKWQNLKLICQAGSATPFFTGGMLSVRWDAPAIAVDTIDIEDLADGDISVGLWQAWAARKNTSLPKYRSEAHQWEYVQLENALVDTDALAADGEEKVYETELTLVQDKDQAATLGVYLQRNTREGGPIVLPLKPRMLEYRAGQALAMTDRLKAALGLDQPGLDCDAYPIRSRRVDPGSATVTMTLETDTPAKHTAALAAAGTVPIATTKPTGEELDGIASSGNDLRLPETFEVADEAEQLALEAKAGDTAIRSDTGYSYVHNGGTFGTMADWTLVSITADPDGEIIYDGGFLP